LFEESTPSIPPVYVPWQTLQTGLDILGQGVPPRVDKSVFGSFSGSNQTLMLSALRAFRLIDEAGVPTPALKSLAENRDTRAGELNGILRWSFPDLVALGEANATSGQLDDAMKKRGLSGETQRKVLSFYLQAAEYAGLPLSKLWPKAKSRTAKGARQSRTASGTSRRRGSPPTPPPASRMEIPTQQQGMTRTVEIPGVGTATLTFALDLFDLSEDQRRKVFDLIDRLRELGAVEDDRHQPTKAAAENGTGEGGQLTGSPLRPVEV